MNSQNQGNHVSRYELEKTIYRRVTALQPIMTRKFRVQIRDAQGKLFFTFKGLVIRKEQSQGRLGGDVNEKLFVKKYQIAYPKRKNNAAFNQANITSQEFGEILITIGKDFIESTDKKSYSLQSFFADLAMLIHDMFVKDAEEGVQTAKQIVSESDRLNDVLLDAEYIENWKKDHHGIRVRENKETR